MLLYIHHNLLYCSLLIHHFFFFFFNDTATTEIYTLSLHDALPISRAGRCTAGAGSSRWRCGRSTSPDRKSTRLNSSHSQISYAVFCLKKKKKQAIAMYAFRVKDSTHDTTVDNVQS